MGCWGITPLLGSNTYKLRDLEIVLQVHDVCFLDPVVCRSQLDDRQLVFGAIPVFGHSKSSCIVMCQLCQVWDSKNYYLGSFLKVFLII